MAQKGIAFTTVLARCSLAIKRIHRAVGVDCWVILTQASVKWLGTILASIGRWIAGATMDAALFSTRIRRFAEGAIIGRIAKTLASIRIAIATVETHVGAVVAV